MHGASLDNRQLLLAIKGRSSLEGADQAQALAMERRDAAV